MLFIISFMIDFFMVLSHA